MNVLVLAPHPDDETIGCGGALCLHAKRGDCVAVVFLTSGELGLKHLPREKAWQIREREAKRAAKILGAAELFFLRHPDWFLTENVSRVAQAFRPVLKTIKPALIYVPHAQEWHPDHKACLPILQAALRASSVAVPQARAYEVWTPLHEYDHVEDITTVMRRKLRALRAHCSQLTEFDYERAVRGLNQFRGALAAKCRYAEVFQNIELKRGK
jgi:N-acetylglucosamine malate deacetylase 1